jgi:hypothetical protein
MENMLLRIEGLRGVLNAGQRVREVKLLVHVWTCSEELETVDTFVAELSKHDYDSALSRAEMLRLATMEWLMERQVRTRWLRINTTFIAFCGNTCIHKYSVVYLSPADKYHRLTRRLSQGQKDLEERALRSS